MKFSDIVLCTAKAEQMLKDADMGPNWYYLLLLPVGHNWTQIICVY